MGSLLQAAERREKELEAREEETRKQLTHWFLFDDLAVVTTKRTPTDDNDKQYAHLLSIRLTEINTVVLSGDKKSFDIKTNTGTLAIQAANKEESDTFTWFSTFQRLIREQKEAFLKQAFKI